MDVAINKDVYAPCLYGLYKVILNDPLLGPSFTDKLTMITTNFG